MSESLVTTVKIYSLASHSVCDTQDKIERSELLMGLLKLPLAVYERPAHISNIHQDIILEIGLDIYSKGYFYTVCYFFNKMSYSLQPYSQKCSSLKSLSDYHLGVNDKSFCVASSCYCQRNIHNKCHI